MEKENKVVYEAPTTDVVEVKAEGAILTMSGNRNMYEEEEI